MSNVFQLDKGCAACLDAETGHVAQPAYYLRLFQSGPVVTNATLLADLTEATFTGYSAIALPDPGASVVTAHVAAVTYPEQSFTITAGSQNIGGWYITNNPATVAYWAQTDANSPVAMAASGLNNLRYTITLKQKDAAT